MVKRKARNGGGKWIRAERRLAIYMRDHFTCVYCLTDLTNATPHNITLDHIVCYSAMGTNASDNLVTACRECNTKRGNKAIHIWASEQALVRISRQTKLALNTKLAKSLLAQQSTK